MSDTAVISLCILWENELREAARLLADLKDARDEEYSSRAVKALNACLVALHSLTDEKHPVLISADDVRKYIGGVSKGEAAPQTVNSTQLTKEK